MKRSLFLLILLFTFSSSFAQIIIDHVEPPNWWVGMKSSSLQLMIHGNNVGKTEPSVNVKGVKIKKYEKAGSDYMFIDLQIGRDVKPCTVTLSFNDEGKPLATWNYELKAREAGSASRKSFTTADNLYLIMPDRFANGDPSNDDMPGMLEKADRNNPHGRHGGDIKGIVSNLDYLQNLGVTGIWCTPLLENNMPAASYHGYAITDLYKVDPRYGTNESYRDMVTEAHRKGIKVIMDMVFNHYGTKHWWMKDLPQKDWINEWPEFTRSNFRGGVNIDPHASQYDKDRMVNGWFDNTMADFNQKNKYVANYLIQNSIWWIEYAGLDGIRQDTYPYSDQEFMAGWMKRLREEYPNFNTVGEVWLNTPQQVASWLDKSEHDLGFRTYLSNVFDFPLMFAIQKAFVENDGWDTGLARLYEMISQDFLYNDPNSLVLFADNHDIERIYQVLKSPENVKMAMAFLFTTRGIPMIYYGTEAFSDRGNLEGDPGKRKDFPGGWAGDAQNFFTKNNLSAEQKEFTVYLSKLMNWRKGNLAVQQGSLTHYVPEDGIYVYFRIKGDQTVMVIMNNNSKEKKVETKRFNENLKGFRRGKDVMDGSTIKDLDKIEIPAKSVRILELSR
ncbi:MAG: glycoside hydrolase family 13 protein [Bacteroidales bacterium]|nr:glycoside hydrolase family 13 protein [Bacteroidales bacterium]